MKNQNLFFSLLFLLASLSGLSQSNIQQATSINSDGAAPHASALLDVSATDKGVLVPRMTTAQRMAISSPAIGLMVFDTDLSCFCFYSGGAWTQIGQGYVAGAGISISGDTISNTGDPNAADDITTGTPAGGDLAGTYPNPTIPANAVGSMEITNGSIVADDIGQMGAAAGQMLEWTGSAWEPGSVSSLQDADGDTKVQVEESPDEDIIRFDLGGTEKMVLRKNTNGTTRLELTDPFQSTVVGQEAGENIAGGGGGGSANTFFGYRTGNANTYGYNNTFLGTQAGQGTISGSFNTAVGWEALFFNTTGGNNTATGGRALQYNTTGLNNSAYGSGALQGNETGSFNTASGSGALSENSTGMKNTANGNSALAFNHTGSYNTASGAEALISNSGSSNTANGFRALASNSTGFSNTSVGIASLSLNTTRSNLVAVGDSSLFNNGTGATLATHAVKNTAVGSKSLFANTTGSHNTALGSQALNANITGNGNTATGYRALFSNIGSGYNTANGWEALFSNTTGSQNTATGEHALYSNITGVFNAAFGDQALNLNTAGNHNTAIGAGTLFNALNSGNTAVGFGSGSDATNSTNCTYLGLDADNDFAANTYSNSTALGSGSRMTASDQVRIGNSSVTSIGGFADWTNVSDGRFKKDVQENVPGLAFIQKLRPVTYHLDVHGLAKHLNEDVKDARSGDAQPENSGAAAQARDEKAASLETGFVAQEVEAAAKELGYAFSGVDAPKNENGLYGLRYAEFVVPLVKAMQEQQALIEAQQQKIQAQQAQLESQAAALQKITNALQTAGIQLEN